MPKIKNLLDKNKLILYLLIILVAFTAFALGRREPQVSIKPLKADVMTEAQRLVKENHALQQRLARLEPPTPVKMVTADEAPAETMSSHVLTVMAEGTHVPFQFTYQDENWVRPDYEPYWHSLEGQWSSVPNRIHNSYHRLFVTLGTKGLWNEALHESGTAELAAKIKLPAFDDNPDNTLAAIALQYQITDVMVLNNQVVLVGAPARNGVQVISINKKDLVQSVSGELLAENNNQKYLFQLATPDGYEVDYSTAVISF